MLCLHPIAIRKFAFVWEIASGAVKKSSKKGATFISMEPSIPQGSQDATYPHFIMTKTSRQPRITARARFGAIQWLT